MKSRTGLPHVRQHTTVTLRTTFNNGDHVTSETVNAGDDHTLAAHLLMLASNQLIGRGLVRVEEEWFIVQLLSDLRARLTGEDDEEPYDPALYQPDVEGG